MGSLRLQQPQRTVNLTNYFSRVKLQPRKQCLQHSSHMGGQTVRALHPSHLSLEAGTHLAITSSCQGSARPSTGATTACSATTPVVTRRLTLELRWTMS